MKLTIEQANSKKVIELTDQDNSIMVYIKPAEVNIDALHVFELRVTRENELVIYIPNNLIEHISKNGALV